MHTPATELLRQAFALDAAGDERAAIPLYRKALASRDLSPDQRRDALLCLGSSLRTTGQLKASIRTLQRARRLHPRDPAVTLFLALAHYDNGQPALAVRQLADMLLKESPRTPPWPPTAKSSPASTTPSAIAPDAPSPSCHPEGMRGIPGPRPPPPRSLPASSSYRVHAKTVGARWGRHSCLPRVAAVRRPNRVRRDVSAGEYIVGRQTGMSAPPV